MHTAPRRADIRRWLPYSEPRAGSLLRLFCFPYAGGGASAFRGWAARLPREVEVHPVQYPGRETRMAEPTLADLDALVDDLLQGLRPVLQPPFAFLGYSMGSLVSFELARALRRRGLPGPAHLFVAARRAAHLPSREPPVHTLDEAAFLRRLGEMDGTPAELLHDRELMELCLPRLRADFTACERYAFRPEAPLEQPITVLAGADDDVTADELAAWGDLTRGPCAVHTFAGGHFFLESAAPALLRTLEGTLASLIRALHAPPAP